MFNQAQRSPHKFRLFSSCGRAAAIGLVLIAIIFSLFVPLEFSQTALGIHPVAAAGGTWIVTTTADSVNDANCIVTSCTLREAIKAANADSGGSETILFANGVTGTITLNATFGTLSLTNTNSGDKAIIGPGASSLAIDGANSMTVFTINSGVTVDLIDLTIQHGKAVNAGGINNSGTLTITDCTISNNAATSDGGGFYNTGTLAIQNSLVSNNMASIDGGGIDNASGMVTMQYSTVSGNSAPGDSGGGMNVAAGIMAIQDSTFSSNSAPFGGGVEDFGSSSGTIQNSTFSGNSATTGAGGALRDNHNSTLTIQNSTFSGNTATSGGNALSFVTGTLNLGSTIMAGNGVSGDIALSGSGTINTLGYNLIGDGTGDGFTAAATDQVGTTANPINPRLAALGSYGGSTQTLQLLFGSPAIGKGDCALGPPAISLPTDQRNVFRKAIGVGCDVGAFEDFAFNPAALPNASQGAAYSQTITANGGVSPYMFGSASGLPSGLSLTAGGLIQGTPTVSGAFQISFSVTDSNGNIVLWSYALTVVAATATPITPTSTPITPSSTPITPTSTPKPTQPDTFGVYRGSAGLFLLRNSNTTGFADIAFTFKLGSQPYPVAGDWTAGGSDTVGLIDEANAQFFLRNNNAAGSPDEQFVLGNPGDEPIAGQWNVGATNDGVGVFRPTNGLLLFRNALSTGFADYVMVLGIPGDQGLAGDWSGLGHDSPGVYRPSIQNFLLSNTICNCAVFADYALELGNPGDNPVTGDWIAQGHAAAGVFRPTNGLILLKNQLQTGFADIVIVYGIPNDVPLAGHWTANVPAFANRPPNVLVQPTAAPIGTPAPGSNNIGD